MGGGKEAQEGGDIGIPIADSFLCPAETNNSVKQLFPNWEKKKKPSNKGKLFFFFFKVNFDCCHS